MNNVISVILVLCTSCSFVQAQSLDCASTHGCWFDPPECDPTVALSQDEAKGCQYVVAWRRVDQHAKCKGYEVTMKFDTGILVGPPVKYLSTGFSFDEYMGHDSVIECVGNPTGDQANVKSYMSYNDGTHNIRLHQASANAQFLNNFAFTEGLMSCTIHVCAIASNFTSHDEHYGLFDLSSNKFKLMVAVGPANPLTHQLIIHETLDGPKFPLTTTEFVSLNDPVQLKNSQRYINNIPRSTQYLLTELHAFFSLVGWWTFATTAFLLAKYFRTEWPKNKSVFKNQYWFELHRDLLVVSMVLQALGMLFVLIQAGDWKGFCTHSCDAGDYYLVVHTWCGIFAFCIAATQPFMAWLRPKQMSTWRSLFNWAHWFLGSASWFLATVTICVSPPLGKTGLQRVFGRSVTFGLIGAYMALTVIVHIALQYISGLRKTRTVAQSYKADLPLGVVGPQSATKQNPDSSIDKRATLKLAALIAYVILSNICVAGLSYLIFTAHSVH